MNYDDWKLSNPIDDEGCSMVSSCCGSEYEEGYEFDTFGYITCLACYEECNIIEDYEYEAIQRENYLEDMRDE